MTLKLTEEALERLQRTCTILIEDGLITKYPIGQEQMNVLRNYCFNEDDFEVVGEDDTCVKLNKNELSSILYAYETLAKVYEALDVTDGAMSAKQGVEYLKNKMTNTDCGV